MLYILWGPDDFTISTVIAGLKKEVEASSAFSSGESNLQGQQITADQLFKLCAAAPFLSGKRLVVIDGLLERFEHRYKQGKPARNNEERREEESKAFASILGNIPETTIIVLVEGSLSATNPLFKEIAGRAVVKSFPLMKDLQLQQWILKRVKDAGAGISNQAAELLVKMVGSNLWAMSNEIEKLVLFAGQKRIEDADVKNLVSQTDQADVFSMVDAILEMKTEAASQTMQRLIRRGAAPTYLLFMISRQVRLIVRASELKKHGASETEIQSRLGLSSGFVVRKTLEQSTRYSFNRLREVYRRLLIADIDIKTGTFDSELALTVLITELSRKTASHGQR